MTKGMPNDADIAIKIAVEGDGIKALASGISNTAVAVLLIRAASNALVRHNKNRLKVGSKSAKGTLAATVLMRADCSKSLPRVIPPAINRRVDQSIFSSSFFPKIPDKKTTAADPRAITAAGIPCSGSLSHRTIVPIKITRKAI